jgi:hypothetical protein
VQALKTGVQSAVTSLGSSKEAAAGSSCSQLQSLLEAAVQQCATLYRKVEHASACLQDEEWVEPAAGSSSSSPAVELGDTLFKVTQDALNTLNFLQSDNADLDADLQSLRADMVTQRLPADSSIPWDSEGTGDTGDSSLQGGCEGTSTGGHCQDAACHGRDQHDPAADSSLQGDCEGGGCSKENQGAAGNQGGREGSSTGGHCQDAACQGGRDQQQQQQQHDPAQALHGNSRDVGDSFGGDPSTDGPSAGQRRSCSQPRPKQLTSWRSCSHSCSASWA